MPNFEISHSPAFAIIDPDGNRTRQEILAFPFQIGRQAGNHLIIRDARASRNHAQVTLAGGDFILEDLGSRHGLFVNGERIGRKPLKDGDKVEFGFPDSFTLVFERPGSRVAEIAEQLTDAQLTTRVGVGGNLARLRAVLEVTRALQSSFSVEAVLSAVVDAALVITRAERGFLLLKKDDELEVRCARDHHGPLPETDLKVPRNLIMRALEERSNTFSMQFHPEEGDPTSSAYALELKSVVCIPLVRIQMTASELLSVPAAGETTGVLYLDTRSQHRDMAQEDRELLETLAMEASTVLENARLLEEERARQHLQEELTLARGIQQSLLPSDLPEAGWLRVAGYSMPSRDVGGDYYDVFRLGSECWCIVVADVAGKGVSSALVAALLQGAFLAISRDPESLRRTLERLNVFFRERTKGDKHATVFCAQVDNRGNFAYINAGHCAPLVMPLHGELETLEATAMPVGLVDNAPFGLAHGSLQFGDRIVIYSDGLTEAQNAEGEFFGRQRLADTILSFADRPCTLLHQAILDAVEVFTSGREQPDDLTLVVFEYRPD